MKNLAIQVARLRAEKGWTAQELANEAGVKRKVILDIENAMLSVSIANLFRVADALGVRVSIKFVDTFE